MRASTKKHEKLTTYIESLLERGEIAFTKKEALKALRVTEIAFDRSSLNNFKSIAMKGMHGAGYIISEKYLVETLIRTHTLTADKITKGNLAVNPVDGYLTVFQLNLKVMY